MVKKVFVVCPVRSVTDEEKQILDKYVSDLEKSGYEVHFPPRDTDQTDTIGTEICKENKEAIRSADEVHVYWSSGSEGSRFDFGMTFMSDRPVKLINKEDVEKTPYKSLQNVLIELDSFYNL